MRDTFCAPCVTRRSEGKGRPEEEAGEGVIRSGEGRRGEKARAANAKGTRCEILRGPGGLDGDPACIRDER